MDRDYYIFVEYPPKGNPTKLSSAQHRVFYPQGRPLLLTEDEARQIGNNLTGAPIDLITFDLFLTRLGKVFEEVNLRD